LPILNCDQEPIHSLGLVQNHGALVAFNKSGVAMAASSNAATLLGSVPSLGAAFGEAHFDSIARDAIKRALTDAETVFESVVCGGVSDTVFDLVIHWSADLLVVEWESRPDDAPATSHYASLVQLGIQKLQRSSSFSLDQLLQVATDVVRTLSGFDRVMAYRFLPDGSGHVVAEALSHDATSYLHQRFPATDIPAQARRLYVLNPIRHMANVWSDPVTINRWHDLSTGGGLDLTYSILRSVSPIHIEYLKNMDVDASMSTSIIVDGKLWGLIACHHTKPLCVPYAVRLSCTVLTQMLAIMVERSELSERALAESRIENLRGRIAEALALADDATAGLLESNEAMRSLIASDGLSVVVGQRVGSFPERLARSPAIRIAESMALTRREFLVTDSISRDLPYFNNDEPQLDVYPGILALQIQGETTITIIWWRAELAETINWAGAPGKVIKSGPNGDRLTPRLSFATWQQTVRGSSKAWNQTDLFAARELKAILQEVALNQIRATEHERTALLAILGHDLRDPLQAIDMAVTLMGRGLVTTGDSAKRIEYSSRRMQSVISYILDVSRLRQGVGLALTLRPAALTPFLITLLDEAQLAFPGMQMEVSIDDLGEADVDEDRLIQAISNLLSNARQHGDLRYPIHVRAYRAADEQRIEIANRLPAGAHFFPGNMTSPLKAGASVNARNKTGLGLGLYIANAIIEGHQGGLKSERAGNDVRFTIVLDCIAPSESGALPQAIYA
jgi:light-regulated signal transduction histidine kinase (bacteriophytochrome)